MLNTIYSQPVLEEIDKMPIRELYVKLELLNWKEENIKEISGLLTGGNIQINGKSSVRRTCSFTFLADDKQVQEYIHLNTKFRLYIGLKNRLPVKYKGEGDILWFKQGVYVFNTASFQHNSTNTTVSVTAKDKMCLLNGDVGGTIPDTVIFHEIEQIDEEGNSTFVQILMYQLIVELVNHYGEEKLQNIFVNNVPLQIRQLMQYQGDRPLFMEYSNDKNVYTGNYTHIKDEASGWQWGYKEFTAGEAIGYRLTNFVFPGELISSPGESVCSILDKIKNVLGNFEYYYDIDGKFHFEEIRNYLNNTYIPLTKLSNGDYEANFNIEDIIYSFKENNRLVSSYNNNPRYENIKNDFVVWGMRKTATGIELPIRYHLAIDNKPSGENWREELYQQIMAADPSATDMGYYEKEMKAEWRKLYDPENKDWQDGWNPNVAQDPASLDFFIDFIEPNTSGTYGHYSVSNIGRRTIAVTDKDCVCVFLNEIPDVIFAVGKEEFDKLHSEGYNVSQVNQGFLDQMRVSANNKSCYDRIRELLYQHLTLNETITVNCLPIYWLEPNRKIEVEDAKSRIYGQYMINSMSIPLTYNGTMNIQASRVQTRI